MAAAHHMSHASVALPPAVAWSGRSGHGWEGAATVVSAEKQEALNMQETRHTGEQTTHPSQGGGREVDLHGLHSVNRQPDSHWPETWSN